MSPYFLYTSLFGLNVVDASHPKSLNKVHLTLISQFRVRHIFSAGFLSIRFGSKCRHSSGCCSARAVVRSWRAMSPVGTHLKVPSSTTMRRIMVILLTTEFNRANPTLSSTKLQQPKNISSTRVCHRPDQPVKKASNLTTLRVRVGVART